MALKKKVTRSNLNNFYSSQNFDPLRTVDRFYAAVAQLTSA